MKDYDVSILFNEERHLPRSSLEKAKKRSDRFETEDYYLAVSICTCNCWIFINFAISISENVVSVVKDFVTNCVCFADRLCMFEWVSFMHAHCIC